MGSEANMAKFAQVGVSATSSQAGASHQGSAFDPLYSQQYSQAVTPQVSEQTTSDDLYSEANYPPEVLPQETQAETVRSDQFSKPQSPIATRITRVEPIYAQEDTAHYEQAPSALPWASENNQTGMYSDADSSETYPPVPQRRHELSRIAAIGCAAASLALVVGIGVWGYNLIIRDVSGVPVVRAVEGPLRVVPENPGGTLADHQGLAVNEIAANGTAAAPADTLQLAPAALALTEEDQPVPTLLKNSAAKVALETPVVDPLTTTSPVTSVVSVEVDTETDTETDTVAGAFEQRENDIDALVASLTNNAKPLTDVVPTSAAYQVESAEVAAPDTGRKITAPRPKLRPAGASATVQTRSLAARSTPVAVTDVEIASLAVGTRLAQLGAYESAEVARQEWDQISSRFGDFFFDKQRVIQRAESGGRVFYRLRVVGFEDLSATRRFCSALVAGNADCIPVAVR